MKATLNPNREKVCKNTDCSKVFKRRPLETLAEWRNRKYCCRVCQITFAAYKRKRGKNPNLDSASLWDACNKYVTKAQEKLTKQVITYNCKNMSQEELAKLIPSEE